MVYAALDERDAAVVRELRAGVTGGVVTPGEEGYDVARAVYLTGVDRRPIAVARPLDATEAAHVVGIAREARLPLAVRSGGHSVAGHGTVDAGIVLDLSALRSLDFDLAGRTAWAGAGMTAVDYTRAAGEHGLATGFGDAPNVGLGGFTLAGGVGFLHRRYGLTIDNLLAAEVVAADGRVVHTDEHTHPGLFWALRGGGGNFGVVTRLRFRLVEVSTIYGGMLILPATPALVAAFIAEAQAAPDALCGMINVMVAPAMPFLPPHVHGTPILMAAMVWDGDEASGERAFAPFRALATPVVDMVAAARYPALYEGHAAPHPSVMTVRSCFADRIDLADAELLLDQLHHRVAAMQIAQFRVLGGAVARVPLDATAFAHRDRGMMVTVAATSFEDAQQTAEAITWTEGLTAALARDRPGGYVNFLGAVDEQTVRAAYPYGAWERLRAIKTAWDPDNTFRLNQNIPPAAG